MPVYEQQITLTSRDRYGSGTTLQTDAPYLGLGSLNDRAVTGFSDVDIPPGGHVLSATVTYWQGDLFSAENKRLRVHGLHRDAAGVAGADLSGTATTAYGTSATVPDGPDVQIVVDVTGVVQELVDLPAWTSGRNLMLRAQRDPDVMDALGSWWLRDYSYDPSLAAKLRIEWQPQGPPVPAFTYSMAGDGLVEFEDLSTPNRHPITGWLWDFGDGTTSTEQHPTHVYTRYGDYAVTLTVTGADDRSASVTHPVHVAPWQLEAQITGSITGRTVDLAALVVTPDPPVTGWQWTMGDGTTLVGQDVQHTYASPGTYTVTLTVTDAADNTVTVTRDFVTREVTDAAHAPPALVEELLAARVRTVTTMVEVIDPDDEVIGVFGGPDATHRGITDGSLDADETRHVRTTVQLTVTNPDLFPHRPGDLLHPLTFNRLRIWRLIEAPDGTWVRFVRGTVYPWKAPTSDAGIPTMRLECRDVAARIARAKWNTTVPDFEGLTATQVIAAIWADRAPYAPTRIVHSDAPVPDDYDPGAPDVDPNEDVQAICDAIGYRWYADPYGTLVAEPIPAPGALHFAWVEGEGCTMYELGHELSIEDTANTVVVTSTSNEVDPPITVEASITDPDHWLSVDRVGRLTAPKIESGTITTDTQARELAEAELAKLAALTQTVDVVHRLDPRLTPGMSGTIQRAASRVEGTWTIASFTEGLKPGDDQRSTAHPRTVTYQ